MSNNSTETRLRSNRKLLQDVAAILMDPNTTDDLLKSTLVDYRKMMETLIQADLSKEAHKTNLKFNNGIAIAPSYAARCLTDFKRTKTFIRGIIHTIEQLKQQGKSQIHIFYAGTGPYATLLLPIMASYPSSLIQCHLMEINEISFTCMKEVIEKLEFQDFIKEYILDDATSYQFDSNITVDILISETMSIGLKDEQQVPILMNLVPQLPEPFILIPQNVKLTLAYMKNLMEYPITAESKEEDYCQRLNVLLETNQSQIRNFYQQMNKIGTDWNFPTKEIDISAEVIATFHNLVVLTEIQVFESEKIGYAESDLTFPVSLIEFQNVNSPQIFNIRYKIDEQPGYIFELRDVE